MRRVSTDQHRLLWEPWHRRFQGLMPHRIREILLVSSGYDAFVLEEDGSLSDRLFYGYSELSLSQAPRLTRAGNLEQALERIAERRFDLVMTVVRLGDSDAGVLARRIKDLDPELPVVLLLFDDVELDQFPDRKPPSTLDHVLHWTGDEGTLIAAIKLVEDALNVAHDTALARVQVILVVEDRVRSYSRFLGLLYREILSQAYSVIAEGLNDYHRSLRMRARPKVVLARNVEEARALYQRFQGTICAVMSDVRLPRGDEESDPEGGLELARLVREQDPYLPMLLQSSESHEGTATSLGAWFVAKKAPDFRFRVQRFLAEALGFGDFVFRLPNRQVVARASDVYEMEQTLRHVPAASLAYHASHNHFSTWMRARLLFSVADFLAARSLDDYDDIEVLRAELIDVLRESRIQEQEGVITDLIARNTGPDNRFIRVGRGSMGGKGRGIAFLSTQIVRHRLLERYPGLEVRIPKTVVLGTDAYDAFMAPFDLAALEELEDAQITEAALAEPLPESVVSDLRQAVDGLKGPLAVRSSSLLEDSRFQPFAGVYATYMLPNLHPDPDVRFEELLTAIKSVYASTLWRDARHYLAGTPHDTDQEKMAVVIQQVVGRRHGDFYYPIVSGVAQSHNDYPVGGQRAEDGVAHLALGLGHTVVGGGVALRFSPGTPHSLPQFSSALAFYEGSQRELYALDLSRPRLVAGEGPEGSLVKLDLGAARDHGTLELVGSVYDGADDRIRDGLHHRGPPVVSFNSILKYDAIPLAPTLLELGKLLREEFGEEVEIEMVLDLPPDEQGHYEWKNGARLYLLQVRPMAAPEHRRLLRELDTIPRERMVGATDLAVGHGSFEDLRDVVWVTSSELHSGTGRSLRSAVAKLDAELTAQGRPYLLIGPGRWGSSDPTLGIGVRWADIAGARVIVETPIGKRRVEPSQGTHFFRNITAARVGYLSITDSEQSWLDDAWLEARWEEGGRLQAEGEPGVRRLRLSEPLGVHIDGRRGRAAILGRAQSRHES
ncbi:MAG: hypothetical protein KC731_27995 [Myxococcales bacterium]|nr:hypothetical protein [Myxococcales bacterium]